jgi:hypothetical protein
VGGVRHPQQTAKPGSFQKAALFQKSGNIKYKKKKKKKNLEYQI